MEQSIPRPDMLRSSFWPILVAWCPCWKSKSKSVFHNYRTIISLGQISRKTESMPILDWLLKGDPRTTTNPATGQMPMSPLTRNLIFKYVIFNLTKTTTRRKQFITAQSPHHFPPTTFAWLASSQRLLGFRFWLLFLTDTTGSRYTPTVQPLISNSDKNKY